MLRWIVSITPAADSSHVLFLSTFLSSASAVMSTKDLYRKDGVRITHDPYAPGMMEKYGAPGQTDSEGFDPYADSVGPGIYGGRVQRDQEGQVVIGRQYQNHNPRPGPIYAGGGYTPIVKALGDNAKLAELLEKYPDLVNDISTGGAQPLHNCGMSQRAQMSTAFLITKGADIEALDTYGYTALHRMASNNLAIGAKALLDAGADPAFRGGVGDSAMQVAQGSAARDVIEVLQEHGPKRKQIGIGKIVVSGAGSADVNGEYLVADASEIPVGFDSVCRQQGWNTNDMWQKLNGGQKWYKAANESYIYWNMADRHWWIDRPDGAGVYKAEAPQHAPPQNNWKLLGSYGPPPAMVATFRNSSQ